MPSEIRPMVSSLRVLPWMGVGLIVLAVIAGVFVSRRSERSLEERRYQALTELKGRLEVARRNVIPAHFGRIRVLGTSELLESDAEGRPVLRIQFDEDLQPAARRNHGENGRVQKILESGIHKDHENIKIDKNPRCNLIVSKI